jgi:UDP-N-acetylglucosamine--N-acetylmuramyl-(pentapeptide) pyrophosphoryl-undecaprenol N-acetylglucosamine transferase
MKVIIAGGGTGGHIYPAIAIADKIKRKKPDCSILFVGTDKGMERELVPANGYEIRFISARGVDRKNPLKNLVALRDFIRGSRQVKRILQEYEPELVIGTGGYVCGPVIRTASKIGIRTFIHEQNAFPGLTNRMLEKYVEKVFVSFPESKMYFKQKHKLVVTGNPGRNKTYLIAVGRNKFSFHALIGSHEQNGAIGLFALNLIRYGNSGINMSSGTAAGNNHFHLLLLIT